MKKVLIAILAISSLLSVIAFADECSEGPCGPWFEDDRELIDCTYQCGQYSYWGEYKSEWVRQCDDGYGGFVECRKTTYWGACTC